MLEGLHYTVKGIHAMCIKLMACVAIVFPWLAPLGALLALMGAVEANYSTVISSINALAAHVAPMPAAVWLGQANRIVPITEILGMLLGLVGLRIAATTVRFLKSCIPTIN